VIVDLAVERGGNVEGAVAGKVVTTANDVKIVGHLNVPGRVAASASLLYARNLFAFLETLVDKTTKTLAINRDDELVKATMLTDGGRIVHPAFVKAQAAAKPSPIDAPPPASEAPPSLAAIAGKTADDAGVPDPDMLEAARGTGPGLDAAPKKARKPAAARPVAGGQNKGDA
jgi:NAD(P) transhydrogenase subunit alpha